MIGKVTRGSDVGGLLRYLYSPGRVNEHVNAHLVAAWLGDTQAVLARLEPLAQGRHRCTPLADRLMLPATTLPELPDRHVWQCSMRLAPGDRPLTEAEWATVARTVMTSTGIAPDGDLGGCRWVAVRHADDHVHIVAVLARQDGASVDTFMDWPKVHAAARELETRLGLTSVAPPSRSTSRTPSRAETEKAKRHGRRESYRTWLASQVRTAAAAATSLQEFEQLLTRSGGIVVGWRYSARDPGQITGLRVGRIGDEDADGRQVWFSGSKLGSDLSLPRLLARWESAERSGRRRPGVRQFPVFLEPLLPDEVTHVLHVIRDVRRILRAAQSGGPVRAPQAPAQHNENVTQRLELAVRGAVDPQTAATILGSAAWPALASELAHVERTGADVGVVLTQAIRRREMHTADDAAAVLHHRLRQPHRGRSPATPNASRPVPGRRRRGRG